MQTRVNAFQTATNLLIFLPSDESGRSAHRASAISGVMASTTSVHGLVLGWGHDSRDQAKFDRVGSRGNGCAWRLSVASLCAGELKLHITFIKKDVHQQQNV